MQLQGVPCLTAVGRLSTRRGGTSENSGGLLSGRDGREVGDGSRRGAAAVGCDEREVSNLSQESCRATPFEVDNEGVESLSEMSEFLGISTQNRYTDNNGLWDCRGTVLDDSNSAGCDGRTGRVW